jgi:hypothetical protein
MGFLSPVMAMSNPSPAFRTFQIFCVSSGVTVRVKAMPIPNRFRWDSSRSSLAASSSRDLP